MGEVYLAQDTRIVRNVAIKIVRNKAEAKERSPEMMDLAYGCSFHFFYVIKTSSTSILEP